MFKYQFMIDSTVLSLVLTDISETLLRVSLQIGGLVPKYN